MEATLTSKGQITIPKEIRDRLKLQTGDKVEFIVDDDGRVELVPVTGSVTRLKGMLPRPKRPVSLEAMEAAIRERAGRS
jgi:AbrB family looped-hinge helix DNA binding protein